MPTLHLTNQVGMQIDIECVDLPQVYAEMRKYGEAGWTSAPLPPGGYVLPYDMADTFDFRLIGGRQFEMDDRSEGAAPGAKIKCVAHGGHIYKRRDLPATPKIKKPLIKYSRGANATDDDESVEAASAGTSTRGYVTLIRFEGNARPIGPLLKPQS